MESEERRDAAVADGLGATVLEGLLDVCVSQERVFDFGIDDEGAVAFWHVVLLEEQFGAADLGFGP